MKREEAIEIIKKNCTEGSQLREACKVFVPELREPEDERMMRVISLALTDVPEERFTSLGTTLKDCLAYLEKQKEQKPNFSEKDSTDFEIEVHEIIAQARNDSRLNDANVLKQFEEEAAFALMLKANKLIEQKLAWSEEDEKRVKQLIYDTEFIKAHYEKRKEELGEQFNNALIRDCDEQIDWLKSLPERFNLTPKQEWSEEDKNKIESIKGLITMGRFADTNTIRTIWELLDSLRPSWKPSKRQMDALLIASAYSKTDGLALRELYEQLLKLIQP